MAGVSRKGAAALFGTFAALGGVYRFWHQRLEDESACGDGGGGSGEDSGVALGGIINLLRQRCSDAVSTTSSPIIQEFLLFTQKLFGDKQRPEFCANCNKLLAGQAFVMYREKPHCTQCYEQILPKVCDRCKWSISIYNRQYIQFNEHNWHKSCFKCANCDKSLANIRLALHDEKPYCIQCFDQKFAPICDQCKEKISCETKHDISYKERHWHERCFKCSICAHTLVDRFFVTKNDALYCSECHKETFAPRCQACSKVFKAGMGKYEHHGKQWHEECFLCLECQQPIGDRLFVYHEQSACCVPCYEQKYAPKCHKCEQVIKRDQSSVNFKERHYHNKCLVCRNCNIQLAGKMIISKEEKPYCTDCYVKLFK